jgi:hypothetical protein
MNSEIKDLQLARFTHGVVQDGIYVMLNCSLSLQMNCHPRLNFVLNLLSW